MRAGVGVNRCDWGVYGNPQKIDAISNVAGGADTLIGSVDRDGGNCYFYAVFSLRKPFWFFSLLLLLRCVFVGLCVRGDFFT